MRIHARMLVILIILAMSAATVLTGCGGSKSHDSAGTLVAEPVDDTNGDGTGDEQDIPGSGDGTLSPIFQGELGVPISKSSLGIIDPDPTGLNPCTDYDGDGLSNTEEITSNEFTADYPMIVTRVEAPITMEIRVSETTSSENYSETLTEEDVKNTREESMDENHYEQANDKTTPVVVKASNTENDIVSESYSLGCTLNSDSRYTDTSSYDGDVKSSKGSEINVSKSASSDFSKIKLIGRYGVSGCTLYR